MKLTALALFVLSTVLCGFRCSFPPTPGDDGTLSIATYNVHNLFDADDDGNAYEEFQSGSGWNGELYSERLENVAVAVRALFPERDVFPDILCLEEIEGDTVLRDLAGGAFAKAGYRWSVSGGPEDSAIVCGILSRYPIEGIRMHRVEDSWGFGPGRDMIEATVRISDTPLTLFVCHWKSRREGAGVSEPARRAAASLLASRLAALRAEDPGRPCVVCGDFNESPDEFIRSGGAYPTAFMPDPSEIFDEYGSDRAEIPAEWMRGGLVVTASKPVPGDRTAGEPVRLYSPWESEGGYSYVFDGETQRLDGFLLGDALFDGEGIEFASFVTGQDPGLMNESGEPLVWNGKSGFSDHLPIAVTLSCR